MRVLIVGAGIAGHTIALCLQRRGDEALVVEKAPSLPSGGYMIDFFGSGYDACERLGLREELERIHYPVEGLVFLDSQGREGFALPYSVLRKKLFDDRHFNFLRGDLVRVLHDRVRGRVDFRFGTTVESIEQEACVVRARLSDGTIESADLLVGADGVHSQVRRLAFGNEARVERLLGYHTAAFILEALPGGLPRTDAFFMLNAPGRQAAVYPVRDRRLATFFLHRTSRYPEPLLKDGPFRELTAVYGDMGWIVRELLEHCPHEPPDLYFDVVSQVELPGWSAGRVVLLGDSCQCVSLLAGQGASLALAAAYVLAEELATCEGDTLAALDRYEVRLRPAIRQKQAAGRRIAKWFVPSSSFRLAIRDLDIRLSLWPGVASLLRRGLAAESVLLP